MMPSRQWEGAQSLLNRLIDGGYTQAVTPVARALADGRASIEPRLQELQREAERLAAAGERLTPNNAVVVALQADLQAALDRTRRVIDDSAAGLVNNAANTAHEVARQLPLSFVAPQWEMQAARTLVGWNRPSAEAINRIATITSGPAWDSALEKYGQQVQVPIKNTLLRGFVFGTNPLTVARELRRAAEVLPASYAQTLTRTTYLTGYRQATAASQAANADIAEYAIRVAALDARVCLACILLHGTRLEIGEAVADHWNGRCTSVTKLRGIPLSMETGEEWFTGQPADIQVRVMGPGAYDAWQRGSVQLPQFVRYHTDELFGPQVNVASLSSLLPRE